MSNDLHSSLWQWIQTLPIWQSDLLRRLMTLEDVSDAELDNAVAMVLRHFGVSDSGPASQPLSALPSSNKNGTVKILALGNLVDVGAIKDGQRLEFKPDALTIVYGDTGSGKTSYARVLRKACRSSAKPIEILPNILSSTPQTSLSRAGTAQIEISIDGTPSTITRDVNASPEPLLSEVTVFDSDSANVYVNEENELIYTPSSLRLLERLASFQDQIRKKIQLKITELGANELPVHSFDPATKSGMLISTLSDEVTPEMVDSLATWTAADTARLDDLRAQVVAPRVNESSGTIAPKRRANSLQQLANALDSLGKRVDENTFRSLSALDSSAAELREVPATVATTSSGQDPLIIGDVKWRALWRAAHEYSTFAQIRFPPNTDVEGAHCPLCQQQLSSETRQRLVRFESHAQADTDIAFASNRNERLGVVAKLSEALSEARATRQHLEAILAADAEFEDTVRQFLDGMCTRAEVLVSTSDARGRELAPLPSNPSEVLRKKAERLNSELSSSGREIPSEVSGQILIEIAELENRLLLSRCRDAVMAHLSALKECSQLRSVYSALATTGLSRKISEFTESAITDQLRTRLRDELQALGGDHIPVRVTARGAKGKTRVSLQLNATRKVDVAYVLSEGERRAVALAFFLAEVAVSEHNGGIVLDDPVSSLDHARRSYVARRIVEESVRRQAIVFTHDIVFLTELQAYARQMGSDPGVNALRRVADVPGVTSQNLPWIAQNVSKRLGHLRNELQRLQAIERKGEQEEYRHEAKIWFELLRETWERTVEEKLFKGAVGRFQPAIETQRLRTVEVTAEMTAAVERGMTRASLWTHDQAAALAKPAPPGSELKEALTELETFVSQFK